MTNAMPPAEVEVSEDLVRALLRDQFRHLAQLDISLAGEGWDNLMYRLGDDYAVRLPRRGSAAALVQFEQEWLPKLAAQLPVATPAPFGLGVPGGSYPWHWSVVPWFEGEIAQSAVWLDQYEVANSLGSFVRELNVPAPPGIPANQYSGGPQSSRFDIVDEMMDTLPEDIDGQALLRIWNTIRFLPTYDGPPLWVHGDLHPANMIVRDGALAAVIDFSELAAGDRSVDLAAGIMLLDPKPLKTFRDAAGDGDDEYLWQRAYGWAILHGVYCVMNSADNPVINAIGRRTLTAVVRDLA